MLVISTGCPCGIGPEVSVAAAAQLRGARCVLVGNTQVLQRAAQTVGVSQRRLRPFNASDLEPGIYLNDPGSSLADDDVIAGRPGPRAGKAQLEYIRVGYQLVRERPKQRVLVTAPVSKSVIASSGAPGAKAFRGHTEYLQALDGAAHSTMCFAAEGFSTSLVTTHLALQRVPRAITSASVAQSTVDLAQLLRAKGVARPRIAIASLNPHAGEGELLGKEEAVAIVPGIQRAKDLLGRRAILTGPVGAETAYRKAASGVFDGVVAMYHDQATIPMKLVAFGDAVNVTMGLSIVRTSVDHGTGYDIAGTGTADARGMLAAMKLAVQLARSA